MYHEAGRWSKPLGSHLDTSGFSPWSFSFNLRNSRRRPDTTGFSRVVFQCVGRS